MCKKKILFLRLLTLLIVWRVIFRIPYNDPRRTSTLDHAIDFCAQNNIDVFDYKGELKLIKELKDKIKSSVQL